MNMPLDEAKARLEYEAEHAVSRAHRADLRAALGRLEELEEHERQTHERLGAILGTDDSLEECAKRLRQRVEELEREQARGWVGYHEGSHPDGTCLVCEAEKEVERRQAASDDQFLRQQQMIGLLCQERDAALAAAKGGL